MSLFKRLQINEFTTFKYHKTVGVIIVRFPVVLLIVIVVQALAEGVIAEFPPFTIIDVFALSSKVLWVEHKIHKVFRQDVVATNRIIWN